MTEPTPGSNAIVSFPLINTPMVETKGGILLSPWYEFFRSMWQRVGATVATLLQGAFNTNGSISITIDGLTVVTPGGRNVSGNFLASTPVVGGAALPQTLTGTSFSYEATFQGTMLVDSGQVTLQRGTMDPVVVSLQGGAFPMLVNDIISVSWRTTPPTVVFLPGGL